MWLASSDFGTWNYVCSWPLFCDSVVIFSYDSLSHLHFLLVPWPDPRAVLGVSGCAVKMDPILSTAVSCSALSILKIFLFSEKASKSATQSFPILTFMYKY